MFCENKKIDVAIQIMVFCIAMNIFHLGRKMHPEGTVYLYRDYYLYHLLTLFGETHHLKNYCLPEVSMLLQYDKENN